MIRLCTIGAVALLVAAAILALTLRACYELVRALGRIGRGTHR